MYDLRMDFDLNAMSDVVRGLADIVRGFMKLAAENPEDDILAGLAALYSNKAAGKVRGWGDKGQGKRMG